MQFLARSGRVNFSVRRKRAQQTEQIRRCMQAAGQITACIFLMREPCGENRVAPLPFGKGQAQQRPQGRMDGQPEILLRMNVGPACMIRQATQPKQAQQTVRHMKEQGFARMVDSDE